ncbi:hypothetical protein [Sanxia water strider virus 9]|uniref:hypothetical protein n=1 Tax=Sanxia water strider virus 9 TaxID=1923408 RepID=UPI00090AD2C3|nr:hypothetical protein [Sanxia water strider virus 9]APG77459.1 hypothetical protein [Sanxia water strider virus 9]
MTQRVLTEVTQSRAPCILNRIPPNGIAPDFGGKYSHPTVAFLCTPQCITMETLRDAGKDQGKSTYAQTVAAVNADTPIARIRRINNILSEWPSRYAQRFRKRFTRRCNQKQILMDEGNFEEWSAVRHVYCLQQLKCWAQNLDRAWEKERFHQWRDAQSERNLYYMGLAIDRMYDDSQEFDMLFRKIHDNQYEEDSLHSLTEEEYEEDKEDIPEDVEDWSLTDATGAYLDLGEEQGSTGKSYNNYWKLPYLISEAIVAEHFDVEVRELVYEDVIRHHYGIDKWTVGDVINYFTLPNSEIGEEQGDDGQSATNLESTATMSSTANITFVDERPVDTTSLHTGSEIQTRDIHNDIGENDWTMTKVLTREYPLQSFEWKVGETNNQKIYSNGLPKIITDNKKCMITRQLQFFGFLRAGIKIRVQLNGTKFHCGRLLVYFKPLTWNDDTEDNFYSKTCYPHFFLDASVSNSGEIVIPFTHLLSYFSQESGTLYNDSINTLGSINIYVYNQLRAADKSSQSLYGQIYASLESPYVHLPTAGITNFSYGDGYMQGLESFLKKQAGGLINSGLGLADKFTGGLVTGAGDALCNLLGICDKPLDPVSAAPIINRTVAPLSHGAGLDRSTRLGLSPIAQTNTPAEILGSTNGDFNMITLCQIPCLLDQKEWNITATTGTKLFDMLVTPVYLTNPQYTFDGTGRYTNYQPTMLAYVSRGFCYWRGGLKLKIQAITTQFHSGRLVLVYDPHGNANVNLTDIEDNKSHNIIIMDIQEQQEIVIDLPNFMVKPWLRCDKFRADANLVAQSFVLNNAFLDCDIAGVFRIFVLNSLVRPDNVTDSVQINIFFYAGDNFELAVPNPVAPLSARKGASTIEYFNVPRYPWCLKGDPQLCNDYDIIYDLYNTGKRLYEQGVLTPGANWYTVTEKIFNQDTICFVYEGKKIQYLMETLTGPCADLIKGLPNYETKVEQGEEQGIESYTTTRDNEGTSIPITDGNKRSSAAPDTTSENAMNLQTLLRRFYPLWVSQDIRHSNGFTIITVPVSPSFAPQDTATTLTSAINRKYDIHNLAWWVRLYTYWRGSMRYKILLNVKDADIYVWHNPVDAKDFVVTSGFTYENVTEQLNFATEVASSRVQQGIEVEVPFYSGFNQLVHSHVSNKADLRAQNGTLYIAVRNRGQDFNVSLFVSTGDDFFLNVLRAPPVVHEQGLSAYVDDTEATSEMKYPELQKALMHTSSATAIPGSFVVNRFSKGAFRNCDIPQFAMGEEQGIVSDYLGIDAVVDVGRNLTTQFEGIKEKLAEATENLPSIMSFVDVLKRQVPIAVDTVQQGVSSLSDVATFGKWATSTLMIGTMIVEFADLIKKFSWLRLVKVIVMMCIYLKVEFHTIISWLVKQVQEMYEGSRPKANDGDTVNEEQSLTELVCDNQDEIVMTMSAIATVIFCSIFGKMPKWKDIRNYVMESVIGEEQGEEQGLTESLRNIHYSVMGAKSLNAAYEFFSRWIEKFINWIIGQECKELQMVRAFNERSQAVLDWLNEIETMDADDAVLEALTNVNLHNKIYALVDTGREFTKWTMSDKVPQNISCVIRDSNKKLMDLVKRINANRPGQGFRYAPFVVMFDGASSIAKTNVMHEFTDMFREELKIPYFNSVYPVPTTAKYLDGYTGNSIIEWDDILQSPEQDALVAEFINWRSNADFKPNMAVAEEKGKIHFLSKVIEMTTNNGQINLNSIRDMNAFRNRINIKFMCHLADGWTVARVKGLQEKDPNYSFMLFDAYFANENGTDFELYRANMSFIDARELTRLHFIRWDQKQNNLVDNYLASHGSLKIPKGIQIALNPEVGTAQMFEDGDQYEDAEEKYRAICGGFLLERSHDLSPDEMNEAELFEYIFDDADFIEKLRYYEMYQARKQIQDALALNQALKAGRRSFWTIAKEMFNRGKDNIQRLAMEIYEKYPRLIQTLGLVAAIGTGYLLFSTMWNMMHKDTSEEAYENHAKMPARKVIKAEMYEPHVRNPAKVMRAELYEPVVKNPTRIVRAEGVEEGSDDPEAVQVARNKIHPLLYSFGWQKGNNPVQLQGLAIGGKVIMTPYHFFRRAKDGDQFYFVRGTDKIVVEFVKSRLQRLDDKDCAIYYVGAQFDSRKSILNCFVKEQDLGRLGKKIPAILVGVTQGGVCLEKSCKAESNQIIKYKGQDEGAEEFVQIGWKYDIDTLKGECGSILIACSKMLPPPSKIVGMHTAGYTSTRGGFSIVLTREQVETALQQIVARHGPQVFSAPLPPQVNTDQDTFEEQAAPKPEGAFTYWGTMDKKFCPSQPQKTCFRATPFQGEIFPVAKIPAALTIVNGISPLKKALTKYGKLTTPFNAKHVRIVKADILNEMCQLEGDMPVEPTSIETAIFGLPGIPYCEKMNMNSSPGWPYQCLPNSRGQKGKAYLFDAEARKISDQLLAKNVMEREELAKQGERYPSIWRDCMKDELRPVEKVKEGKTRLFTIAPADYTVLVRKYFFAFEQMFYKNHSKFFSAVGINPESYEWTVAYNRLRQYGNKCCAGDFASYDGTLMADLMFEVGEIIDDWYKLNGEKDEQATAVRRVLIDEMIHTYQLINNCVYKTHQGNPSGNPLTVIINTMVNVFYMRLVWMEIMSEKKPQWATMDEYHQNVIEEAYGDDNRLVIKQKVIDLYNQITITECLARHKITYTDELKSGECVKYRKLEETSFLKRSYRIDSEIGKEIMLPKIDITTISGIINWYREAEFIDEQLQANMRAALGFSFFHGREFYDKVFKQYQQVMRREGVKPICTVYDEQLDRFLAMIHGNEDGVYENFVELGF